MLVAIPPLLILVSIPLQLLGFTGTCTQGSDGTYVSGAVFSLLPLAAAIVIAPIASRAGRGSARVSLALLFGLFASLALVVATRPAWMWAVQYYTACGPDFDGAYSGGFDAGDALIVLSYGLLPMVYAVLCGVLLFRQFAQPR